MSELRSLLKQMETPLDENTAGELIPMLYRCLGEVSTADINTLMYLLRFSPPTREVVIRDFEDNGINLDIRYIQGLLATAVKHTSQMIAV